MIGKRAVLAVLAPVALLLAGCEKGPPSDTVGQIRKERIFLIGSVPFEAPLLYSKGKEFVGPEALLAERVYEKIRATIVEEGGSNKIAMIWATRTYDALVPALVNGEFQLILGVFGITEERSNQVAFSESYYTSELVMMHNPPRRDVRPDALDGMKIAIREGTAVEAFVRSKYSGSSIVPMASLDEAILALKRGELDAVIEDRYLAAYSLDTIPGVAHLEIISEVLGKIECAVAVRKNDRVSAGTYPAFLEMINEVISEVKSENLYGQWLQEETGELLARVESRHADRLESLKPRQLVIRLTKDQNYDFDVYRAANLTFRLTDRETGKSYSSSRIRFRGKVGFSTTKVPPGLYRVTLPKMSNWSPGAVNIIPADPKEITVKIRLQRGGTSTMTRS